MGCCDVLIKYIVFLFNFVFFLTSVALIGIGAYIQIHMTKYLDFLGNTYLNTSIILIIIGALMLIVTFFGCCGACTENPCMMYTYGTMLTLILLSLIGVAITVFVFRGDARKVITNTMTDSLKNYGESGHNGVTETWNIMQSDFQCCGVNNSTDWATTPKFQDTDDVPDTCCKVFKDGCGKGKATSKEDINSTGCFVKFENFISSNATTAIGVGVGVIVLLFLGICVSCCVARGLASKNSSY
jgi:CD63 antigen